MGAGQLDAIAGDAEVGVLDVDGDDLASLRTKLVASTLRIELIRTVPSGGPRSIDVDADVTAAARRRLTTVAGRGGPVR